MTDDDRSSNTGKADKITSATVSTGTSANSEVNVRLADTCGTSTALNRW